MSTIKTKRAPAAFNANLFTIVPLVVVMVVVVLAYFTYSYASQDCEKVIEHTKKMVANGNYKKTYDYLKAKQTVCKTDANSKKPNLHSVQYQRFLAISAFKAGDQKIAGETAQAAVEDYQKLSNSDKEAMGDGFIFLDSMLDISEAIENKETQS